MGEFDWPSGEFKRAWADVKFKDDWSIDEVLANLPTLPVKCVAQEYGDEGDKLLRICTSLQRSSGKMEPFYLSCRTAAPALGLSFQDAALLLRALVTDGWLEFVKKGSGLKASRYRMPLALETTAKEQP